MAGGVSEFEADRFVIALHVLRPQTKKGPLLAEPLADEVLRKIDQATDLYHRLVIVVAPSGEGKTAAFQEVKRRTAAELVNVNLELARRMLEFTERQRALQLPRLLADIVGATASDVVLLDNIEILFDITLKQDPPRMLQGISRSKTVVAAWSGSVAKQRLIYATPGHSEHRSYPIRDLLVVTLEDMA